MCRAVLISAFLTVLLPVLTTAALADFRLCNNTWFPTFAVFAYEDKQQGPVAVGWFEDQVAQLRDPGDRIGEGQAPLSLHGIRQQRTPAISSGGGRFNELIKPSV